MTGTGDHGSDGADRDARADGPDRDPAADRAAERADRARRALGEPPFASLWAQARRRLEGNGASLSGTPLRLDGLGEDQRVAVAGLLGVSPAGTAPLRVGLEDLDALLRRGAAGIGLVDLLIGLGGPLRDRRGERATERGARADAWEVVEQHPLLGERPELGPWAARLRRSGTATRLGGSPAEGARLVGQALDILAALPGANVPLAVLAGQVTGDAHALDRGRPLGTLVASALAELDPEQQEEEASGGRADWPTAGAYWWRRRWARVGVLCDDLSVSVLVLALPVARARDVIGEAIEGHAFAGEPLRLTLRQLAVGEVEWRAGAVVHVCENPSVLAQAAVLLEDRSAPLVCVEGEPNSAAHELLGSLAAAGARFRYHGDFDWDGLRIGAGLVGRYGMEPWRFGEADYEAAAPLGRVALGTCRRPVETPWSPGLPGAMAAQGVAIHEEQVLDDLLADLAGPDGVAGPGGPYG